VSHGRRNDTNEIDIVALDQLAPIGGDMIDAKLFGNAIGVFTMSAGNGDYARAFAIAKAGNLSGPRKASADDSNADCLPVSHFGLPNVGGFAV
jgi:hypothetical protein